MALGQDFSRRATEAPQAPWFRARRVTHANLVVSDLAATLAFYTGVAGIAEAYRTPQTGGGFVSNGNTHHDLGFLDIQGPLGFRAPGGKPGLYHLGFELECEVDLVAGYERARGANVELRAVDHDITHSLYALAPNGFTSEIYADVIHDFRSARSGIVDKPKPKWAPGMTPPIAERLYHLEPQWRRVDAAPLHPQRFSHAALVVDDYEASFDHYTQLAGMVAVQGGRDTAYCALAGSTGEPGLHLARRRPGGSAGCHHLGFRVDDVSDLERSIETLRRRGIPVQYVIDHPARLAVYLRDPDGVLLQFFAERGPLTPGQLDDELAIVLA